MHEGRTVVVEDTNLAPRRARLTATLFALVLATAACSRPPAPPPAEPPSLDVTSWTDKSELFMEYPPLVAGQTVRFAVHLTRLGDFRALESGRPHIEMTPENGGSPTSLPGTEPLRPGAFRVEGRLPAAGRYRWALVVDAPGLADRHDLGVATVFAGAPEAIADAEKRAPEDLSAIAYLKEQQWTNEFGTALVREDNLRTSIRVPAAIEPLTGGEAIVSAPAAGRFTAASLPSVGDRVGAGQALGRLEPRLAENGGADRATLQASVSEAQASLDAARADLTRAERLLGERAVPARRVEEAQRAVKVAEARMEAAQARLAQRDETLRSGGGAASGNAFVLRAPIAGRVAEIFAALGASYDEGAPLFRIVRTDRLELQAQVPPADAPLPRVAALALEVPGRPEPIDLEPDHVHDAGVFAPKTHALPVQIEVANPGGQLLVGQTGTAIIYTGASQRVPVVPRAAVLTEAGRPYVFVQTGGESFSRRFIEIASRDGDRVGIRAGVKPGERVVTRGAYEVQLASAASGLPAEGHVH